jgi:anion-transporting  ArsA/GET3 family ATPase
MSKKVFTKISETTFKVEEERHLEDVIDTAKQFEQMAGVVSKMRQVVSQVSQFKTNFNGYVDWYNTWVDILTDAKDTVKLAIKVPERIELSEGYKLEDIDINKLPRIDIRLDIEEEDVKEEVTE